MVPLSGFGKAPLGSEIVSIGAARKRAGDAAIGALGQCRPAASAVGPWRPIGGVQKIPMPSWTRTLGFAAMDFDTGEVTAMVGDTAESFRLAKTRTLPEDS